MKHKNKLKQIITTILVAALLITGISLDGTVTATAATDTIRFQANSTVTMKLGDTKRIALYTKDSSGAELNCTYVFTWASSNESVLSITNTTDEYITVTVNGKGTADIIATVSGSPDKQMKMTVKVAGSKMTAKQKKCKHSWKTTKAATCQRTGVKTCKKCKWQKSIKKTAHKYVNITSYDYETYDIVIYCQGCDCEGAHGHSLIYHEETGTKCTTYCPARFSTEDYGTPEACEEAYRQHLNEAKHKATVPYASTMEGRGDLVAKTVKACTYCGKEK